MMDPIVEEIRMFRMKHTQKFDYNIHAICEDIKKYQHNLTKDGYITNRNQFDHRSEQDTQLCFHEQDICPDTLYLDAQKA